MQNVCVGPHPFDSLYFSVRFWHACASLRATNLTPLWETNPLQAGSSYAELAPEASAFSKKMVYPKLISLFLVNCRLGSMFHVSDVVVGGAEMAVPLPL